MRRGGPNYVQGLAKIREAAERLGLDMEIHGPEMHMTAIVKKALDTLPKEAS
jgi:ATP-citrate lyase beta-subunit